MLENVEKSFTKTLYLWFGGYHSFARTSVKELAQSAILLPRRNQRGGADSQEHRRRKRRAEPRDLKDVRVRIELLAYRPLVIVGEIRFFASDL